LDALERGAATTAYNLGNGRGFSVREVIDTTRTVTGRTIVERIGPKRQGDPACLVGDSTRILSELGWKPRFSALSDIIESAWRWQQSGSRSERGAV
jgi:UDP-glucose 4-epimerase